MRIDFTKAAFGDVIYIAHDGLILKAVVTQPARLKSEGVNPVAPRAVYDSSHGPGMIEPNLTNYDDVQAFTTQKEAQAVIDAQSAEQSVRDQFAAMPVDRLITLLSLEKAAASADGTEKTSTSDMEKQRKGTETAADGVERTAELGKAD